MPIPLAGLAGAALWIDRANAAADIGFGGKQIIDGLSHGDNQQAGFGAIQAAWGLVPGVGLAKTALKGKAAVEASKKVIGLDPMSWIGRGTQAAFSGLQVPELLPGGGGMAMPNTPDPAVETVMRTKMAELSGVQQPGQGGSFGGNYSGQGQNTDPLEAYRNQLYVSLIN